MPGRGDRAPQEGVLDLRVSSRAKCRCTPQGITRRRLVAVLVMETTSNWLAARTPWPCREYFGEPSSLSVPRNPGEQRRQPVVIRERRILFGVERVARLNLAPGGDLHIQDPVDGVHSGSDRRQRNEAQAALRVSEPSHHHSRHRSARRIHQEALCLTDDFAACVPDPSSPKDAALTGCARQAQEAEG